MHLIIHKLTTVLQLAVFMVLKGFRGKNYKFAGTVTGAVGDFTDILEGIVFVVVVENCSWVILAVVRIFASV